MYFKIYIFKSFFNIKLLMPPSGMKSINSVEEWIYILDFVYLFSLLFSHSLFISCMSPFNNSTIQFQQICNDLSLFCALHILFSLVTKQFLSGENSKFFLKATQTSSFVWCIEWSFGVILLAFITWFCSNHLFLFLCWPTTLCELLGLFNSSLCLYCLAYLL